MVDLKYYRKWAKIHPNFMTPHIISLKDRDVHIIELSEGTDFNHKPIYGVTLLRMCGSTFTTSSEVFNGEKIDQMFYSKESAKHHIKTIVEPYLESLKTKTVGSA